MLHSAARFRQRARAPLSSFNRAPHLSLCLVAGVRRPLHPAQRHHRPHTGEDVGGARAAVWLTLSAPRGALLTPACCPPLAESAAFRRTRHPHLLLDLQKQAAGRRCRAATPILATCYLLLLSDRRRPIPFPLVPACPCSCSAIPPSPLPAHPLLLALSAAMLLIFYRAATPARWVG